MTSAIPHLADYTTSRMVLLDEAEARGATLEHYQHPLAGPDGAALWTDVARFGAPIGEARSVVVIASGTHGVEGHGGWGLQRLVVGSGRLDTLPDAVTAVLIHAVNPYGMAWSRRVDHDNIDINRNFVDFDRPLPRNPDYDLLSDLINPTGDGFDPDDTGWKDALWAKAAEIGVAETFRAISGGQYHQPTGIQFGGAGPSWSTRTLRTIWARHLTGARAVINLDLHTGLGPCGGLTIFQSADEGDPSAELAAQHFDDVARSDRPETTDPIMVGVLGPGLEAALDPSTLSIPLVVEFGTRDTAAVLASMRSDNWLHQRGDPCSPLGERIRAETRATFFVDDESWRARVADQGMATVFAALDVAARHPGL